MAEVVLYMLIDVSTVETTKVLKVAPLRHVQMFGAIERAHGKTVIAPPLEGRGFSKLEKLPLQYLYWNTFGETPPEDYAELVKTAIDKLKAMPLDPTPLSHLEREIAKLYPDGQTFGAGPKQAEKRVERRELAEAGLSARPKAGSSTGAVWELCDSLSKNGAPVDRKVAIAACVEAGINQATASTQYSKWAKVFRTENPGS